MKSLIWGATICLLFLIYGILTKQWGHMVHWMLIVGTVGCLVAAIFTGGARSISYMPRMEKDEKKIFFKISRVSFLIGIQNLIVAAIVYYSSH